LREGWELDIQGGVQGDPNPSSNLKILWNFFGPFYKLKNSGQPPPPPRKIG